MFHQRRGRTKKRSRRAGRRGNRQSTRNRRNRIKRTKGGNNNNNNGLGFLAQAVHLSSYQFVPELAGWSTILLSWSMALNPILLGLTQKNDYINAVYLLQNDPFLDCNAVLDKLLGPAIMSQENMQLVTGVFGKRQLLIMMLILPTFCGLASSKIQLPANLVQEATGLLRRMVRETNALDNYSYFKRYKKHTVEELGPGQAGGAVGISSFLLQLLVFLLLFSVAQTHQSVFQLFNTNPNMELVVSSLQAITTVKQITETKEAYGYDLVNQIYQIFHEAAPNAMRLAEYQVKLQTLKSYYEQYKQDVGLQDVDPLMQGKLQRIMDVFFEEGAVMTYLAIAGNMLDAVRQLNDLDFGSEKDVTLLQKALGFLAKVGQDAAYNLAEESLRVAAPSKVKEKRSMLMTKNGEMRFVLQPSPQAARIQFSIDVQYLQRLVQMSNTELGEELAKIGSDQSFLNDLTNNAVAVIANQISGTHVSQYTDHILILLSKFGAQYIENLGEFTQITAIAVQLLTVDEIEKNQAIYSMVQRGVDRAWALKEAMFRKGAITAAISGVYSQLQLGVLGIQNWLSSTASTQLDVMMKNPAASTGLFLVASAPVAGVEPEELEVMNNVVQGNFTEVRNISLSVTAEDFRHSFAVSLGDIPDRERIAKLSLDNSRKQVLYQFREYLDSHNYDDLNEPITPEAFPHILEEFYGYYLPARIISDRLDGFTPIAEKNEVVTQEI